jgi:hypothetical protein
VRVGKFRWADGFIFLPQKTLVISIFNNNANRPESKNNNNNNKLQNANELVSWRMGSRERGRRRERGRWRW